MKKQLVKWTSLVLAMVLVLSGCGKKDDLNENKPADAVIQEDVTEKPSDVPEIEEQQESVSQDTQKEEKDHTHVHVSTGTVYMHEWQEEYMTALAHAEYPVIKLEECCEEKFEALEDAIDDLNEKERATVRNQYWDLIDSAKEMFVADDPYFMMHEVTENVSVRRADASVLSLLYYGYSYLGGAHGMTYYWGKNFDVKTGKELLLSDVVSDMDLLPGIVKSEMEQYVPQEALFGTYDEVASYVAEEGNGLSWVLDYNGISLFFDPYEIGSYAAGPQVITLSFAEYPNLVKSEYQQIPESFGIELTKDLPFYYDLDGDNAVEKIDVWGEYDAYDTITNLVVQVDDVRYKESTYAYGYNATFVHTKNGNYLYIESTSDNDYRSLNIIKFNGETAEGLGYLYAGWHNDYVEDKEYYMLEQALTDPGQFKLDVHMDTLSTTPGYKNYVINEKGVPASADPYYYTKEGAEITLTVLQPLSGQLVDKDTNAVLGDTTLEPGTKVIYHGSDKATAAYVKLSDGSIVKLEVQQDTWPVMIAGVVREEAFDGMMFAG